MVDRKRILLVDDEQSILVPMARYLRAQGFSVDTAASQPEAEALTSQAPYDLVILDLSLAPGGGNEGLQLLRNLRQRDPQSILLVVTAHSSPELQEEARTSGANAVLTKPQPLSRLAQLAFASTGAEPLSGPAH
ncbi:MAG TPA: response regulator [Vicinamibacteria bacterium]